MKSAMDFSTHKLIKLVLVFICIVSAVFIESKPMKQKPKLSSNARRFARSLLNEVSPKSVFITAINNKDNPQVNRIMGQISNNLLNSLSSRIVASAISSKHKPPGINKDLFGDLGGLINQGGSIINGIINNNNNNNSNNGSNLPSLNGINLDGVVSSIGQDLDNLWNQMQNTSGGINASDIANQVDQGVNALINTINQQNPNLINDLNNILSGAGDTNGTSVNSIDNMIDQGINSLASDILADVNINTLDNIVPAIGSVLNETGVNVDNLDGLITIFMDLLNTSDVNSIFDSFESMILNDTQMIRTFFNSLPSTYGELKSALIQALVEAVEEYFQEAGITAQAIENEIEAFIGNLTNNNQQVMNALDQFLPELINELQSFNTTEIIDYLESALTSELDTMQIDYTSFLQGLINMMLPNISSSEDMELIKHLEQYIPDLIGNLSQANSLEQALQIIDPIVAYHLVYFFNLSAFASEHNLPVSTTEEVLSIIVYEEVLNLPFAAQLMNASSLEDVLDILDPYIASLLAQIFNLPSGQSTMDVFGEIVIQLITDIPFVNSTLSDPNVYELIEVFNQTYSATSNMTQAVIAVLDYIENDNDTDVVNKTKQWIAMVWPDLFLQVENDTDERVIAGKALGAAISDIEGFFAQFGITVPTNAMPTVTPASTTAPPVATTTTNSQDGFLQSLVNQIANQLSNNISNIVGQEPTDLTPANIIFA